MNIKILGPGCSRCKATVDAVQQAAKELSITPTVQKIEDVEIIMRYNVLATPAVVIDEKLLLSGHVPTVTEMKQLMGESA